MGNIKITFTEKEMLLGLGRRIGKKASLDRIEELNEIYHEDVETRLDALKIAIKALKKERRILYNLINPNDNRPTI